MTKLDERPTLDERLEAILARPRTRDVVAARRAARARCDVPSCGEPGRLYPCGHRCDEHGHRQPEHRDPITSHAVEPVSYPLAYGSTTGDPAGRNGEGWVIDKNSRLPRWAGAGPAVRRAA